MQVSFQMPQTTPTQTKNPRQAYIILAFVLPLSILSLSYQYFVLPRNLEKVVRYIFEEYTNGKISLKIKKASLFYGFEIEDCKLVIKKTKEEIFYFKRMRFSTFLPAFLAGEVSIRRLHIEDGRLYVKKKKGYWNWGIVFGPFDEEHDEINIPEIIPTFFPLRIHVAIDLKNFSFYMDLDGKNKKEQKTYSQSYKQSQPIQLAIEGIHFNLGLISSTFSAIPLNMEILKLFDTIIVSLNPQSDSRISFLSRTSLTGNLASKFFIYREKNINELEFHSRLFLDLSGLKVRNQTSAPTKLDFQIIYEIFYNAIDDRLILNRLELKNKRKVWLKFVNTAINHMTLPERTIQLEMNKGHIDLKEIGNLVSIIGGIKKRFFDGVIELDKISIYGGTKNLKIHSIIHSDGFLFWMGDKEHQIKNLDLDISALLDLGLLLPTTSQTLLDNEKQKEKEKNTKPLFLGIFRKLNISSLELDHKDLYVQGFANVSLKKGVQAHLKIRDWNIGFFSQNYMNGIAQGDLKLSSPLDFHHVNFNLNSRIQKAAYKVFASQSYPIYAKVEAQGKLVFDSGIDTVDVVVDNIHVDGLSQEGRRLVALHSQAHLLFTKAKQSYQIKKTSIALNGELLYPTLPSPLKDVLAPYRLYFTNRAKKGLTVSFPSFHLKNEEQELSIKSNGFFTIPALRLYDLKFDIDLGIAADKILFRKIDLHTLQDILSVSAIGKLEKGKKWEIHMDVNMKVYSEKFVRVHENISVQGKVDMVVALSPKEVDANLEIQDLNLEYFKGNCQSLAHPDCQSFSIHNLSLDNFSIQHLVKSSLLKRKKEEYPQNNYQHAIREKQKYNLRVERITSSHNPSGKRNKRGQRWHYVGRPRGKNNGLEAILQHQNNIFYIPNLKIDHFHFSSQANKDKWKRNGSIEAKNIYLDLFDLRPEKMSAAMQIKIQELDLRPFFSSSFSSYDGSVSANLRVRIDSFGENMLEKIDATLSVHRISPEFGGFLTQLFIPAEIMSLLIRSTLEIPAMRFSLQNGLMYSYIQVQTGGVIPGILLSSSSEEIKEERVPIHHFLNRAKAEVKKLKEEKIKLGQ